MAKSDAEWGLCKDCKWWQLEPGASVADTRLGVCIEEKLQKFRLRISGLGGCTQFMPGKAAHAKGSSEAPPTTVASR